MVKHLLLPAPHAVASRRAPGSGGAAPSRQRGTHSAGLSAQLSMVVQSPRRLRTGVDPALVFKIDARARPTESALENRGLTVLSETQDFTYYVLSQDEGAALATAIEEYGKTGALKSLFDNVDHIGEYGPEDRTGPGVAELLASSSISDVTVDVSIWPGENYEEAAARAEVVLAALEPLAGRVDLRSITARRPQVRVTLPISSLPELLGISVVERVRTPPVPFVDFRDWWNLDAEELDRTASPSATVGVLDDLPHASHPLLTDLVLSAEELSPPGYAWLVRGNHGTEVVGRVVYPDLDRQLRQGTRVQSIGNVRVVRVIEPDPARGEGATRFPKYALPHEIVEKGVRHLHGTFGVKVFNLSVGYADAFSESHVGALTELIDDLVRELKIVVVVPTGNASISRGGDTPSGHHVHRDHPSFFAAPEHRLAEPAPAALAISVGSVALSEAPAELPQRFGWHAVAPIGATSPFSRIGPGLGTAAKRLNKPEVVHFGGNTVLNDIGQVVPNDPGAGVVTTSLGAAGDKIFSAVNGTSFSAPSVTRVAADIAHAYPDASANLIRALLVGSARHTEAARSIHELPLRHAQHGFGIPDSKRATESYPNDVTMTYDGRLAVDTVAIHPFPVPELFRRGSGSERVIQVALAYDPPVRRQRREYIAGTIKLDIYRDIELGELNEMLKKQDPANPHELVSGHRRLKLEPGSTSFLNSTTQVRSWRAKRSFTNDDETYYLVLTHSAQTWARNSSDYTYQDYAVTVSLRDEALIGADLHQLLTQRVTTPARVRLQS